MRSVPSRTPKRARARRDPEGTRARLLAAARARIEEVGFEAMTLRDVAAAADVANGTVILHFPDKTQLLHAAFFEDLAATWARAKALPSTGVLVEDLSAIAGAFFDYYTARPTLSRALLRESLFAASPWRERFVAQVDDVSRHVVALVVAATERGELVRAPEPDVFAASFLSFYYFALLACVQGGHPAPRRLFTRMLEQHLIGNLQPHPRGKRK